MLFFENDYTEGAHEKILISLIQSNDEKLAGYGQDQYSRRAKEKIRAACECPAADIHFLVGGTQTNATVIGAVLQDFEGVVAAKTGHISTHEAGAVEYTGHKVLEIDQQEGKLQPNELMTYLNTFWSDQTHEHMVFPGMVYLSHPTEYGTLYTADELRQLSAICQHFEIPLYLDGARLGYGLASKTTDVTLPVIAECCDIFYIGGTKVGALCGEAVVFTKKAPKHFNSTIKQHGALLAKGRLLGVQFDALFTDNLYYEISRQAIEMADLLKQALKAGGYKFYLESPTNQQFIILENQQLQQLEKQVRFSFWERYDQQQTVVRFATSWATKEKDIAALAKLL